ncbi:MAG TPA: TonB-dependent receptor, partial [Candidatus Deferrimicrobiaceae bacterium]|nr:TonB-dependent receptor [Candidatus Deferrimicrobiaceae bacterium]
NPKFGVTWNPVPNTTIRAAAFRVLKRTLITNQTLEPTQVAGFNQFFDDPEATKAWRYGAAVDQRFARSVYAGAEYSLRELDVPFQDLSGITPVLGNVDWKERVGRAYLYWAPHPWLALNSEYLYERFEREDKLAFGAREVTTHRIPVGANFFHPSGLSAMFKATHIDQQGSFEPNNSIGTFTDGGDHFWLVDAAIGYRLPQRLGILSVGAKNLFDKSFQFFDTDPVNPAIQPARMFFARVTLSL